MANATVGINATFTCVLQSITWLSNGDYAVNFVMIDASGVPKRSHNYTAKGDGSGVYDEAGNVIAATTPAGLLTTLGNVKTNIDSALANAASAGKITL
jgi:hypothetical protein